MKNWTDANGTKRRECLGCGNDVPQGIAKTHGDNQGCVPACPECIDRRCERTTDGSLENWGHATRLIKRERDDKV